MGRSTSTQSPLYVLGRLERSQSAQRHSTNAQQIDCERKHVSTRKSVRICSSLRAHPRHGRGRSGETVEWYQMRNREGKRTRTAIACNAPERWSWCSIRSVFLFVERRKEEQAEHRQSAGAPVCGPKEVSAFVLAPQSRSCLRTRMM